MLRLKNSRVEMSWRQNIDLELSSPFTIPKTLWTICNLSVIERGWSLELLMLYEDCARKS